MDAVTDLDVVSLGIARRWCEAKGAGWSVTGQAGKGGTAPVFSIVGPDGSYALKINDERFSTGPKSQIEAKRVEQQLALKGHDCPSLIQVFDGGMFESRLVLLMNHAPGRELEKRLSEVPRGKIRYIVDQVARAILFLRGRALCHRDIKSANIFVSDDFKQVTLLDLSVLRDIHDPVGLGTDHGDQLPVVATARYSPPEYLFRLLDPGPDLWHALDVYQLGALLHDLIMRQPLFQAEYDASKENRYRFAWAVATVTPSVHAEDVDQDLIFLARRALDKNWRRRSAIPIGDFLASSAALEGRAMEMLGLKTPAATARQPPAAPAQRLRMLRAVAQQVDDAVVGYLRSEGVTAEHESVASDAESYEVRFSWLARPGANEAARPVKLRFALSLEEETGGRTFACSALLSATINSAERQASLAMPSVCEGDSAATELAANAVEAFRHLAVQLSKAEDQ